ncbi:MAG: mechanosensitive ion channel family protein, partial [Rhodospirillales bacterium]
QFAIGRAYNAILKRIFDARGIEIPFPHQTIYFGEDKNGRAPAGHIALRREDEQHSIEKVEKPADKVRTTTEIKEGPKPTLGDDNPPDVNS